MTELWKSLLASRCVCLWVFLCSSPASAGKVSWWLSGGSQLRLCLRWASLKCCQTKRTHFPCSPFPQSNMLRVWIVITVKSAFGTCLASSAQPWGGSRAVSGSATGCVCAPCFVCGTLRSTCVYARERGSAGTRGRFCQEEFAHMTRDLFPPNWLSMPLLPLLPFVCLPACCHISILTETLDLMSGIVVLRPQGAFFSALFCGWYRKLWLSPSDEQIKRFDNDFDA